MSNARRDNETSIEIMERLYSHQKPPLQTHKLLEKNGSSRKVRIKYNNDMSVVMPYCKTVYSIPNRDTLLPILSKFTKENFIQGRAAYEIDATRFAIDAGENDIRAIYSEESCTVRFFCRYVEDLTKYDNKLQKFAVSNGINITKLQEC